MISSVIYELTKAAAEGRMVTIQRRDEWSKQSGVPLAVGSRLVLLRYINPDMLVPDGYVITRLQDAVAVEATDWDRAVERALVAESRLPDAAGIPAVRLDGWLGALEDLHALGEPLSVDCEEDETGYFLGAITGVYGDGVDMRHIGTGGAWEERDWTVDLDAITRVAFRSRYIEVFSRLAGPLIEQTDE